MNKTELAQRINTAADALSAATTAKADAARQLAAARQELSSAEAAAIRAGVEGKNEAERKAKLSEITAAQQGKVQEAENAKLSADTAYDVAKIQWDSARQLVSIYTSAAE